MPTKVDTLTIRVSAEEKELVKALAAEKDQTVSKYLYNLLIKNIKQEKK